MHLPQKKLQTKGNQIKMVESKKITKNTMTQSPWVPNASKGNLNLSIIQNFMEVSFSM